MRSYELSTYYNSLILFQTRLALPERGTYNLKVHPSPPSTGQPPQTTIPCLTTLTAQTVETPLTLQTRPTAVKSSTMMSPTATPTATPTAAQTTRTGQTRATPVSAESRERSTPTALQARQAEPLALSSSSPSLRSWICRRLPLLQVS